MFRWLKAKSRFRVCILYEGYHPYLLDEEDRPREDYQNFTRVVHLEATDYDHVAKLAMSYKDRPRRPYWTSSVQWIIQEQCRS